MLIKYPCPICDNFLDVELRKSEEITLINGKGSFEFEDIECPNCKHTPYMVIDFEVE